MQINANIEDKFDFLLFLVVLIMVGIGLVAIYSATQSSTLEQGSFDRQIISAVLAIFAFFGMYFLSVGFIKSIVPMMYLFAILLLIAVLFVGTYGGGSRSWLAYGGFTFQPAEFAKLATVLTISAYLSRNAVNIDSLKDIVISICIGIIPVGLILMEPDLGSSIVFFGIIFAMIFWKGISLFGVFIVLSPGFIAIAALFGIYFVLGAFVIVIVLLFYFKKDLFLSAQIFALNIASAFFVDYIFNILSPHQKSRILAFIDPMSDPQGTGYNSIQAQIAIGSGGLFGKGFLQGNQTQLQYIPEQKTDFIFCVIGEEFGFIGSVVILVLFLFLFLRMMKIVSTLRDEFASLATIGILSTFFIHFAINIGMAIGIMPVIGIPLTFISYGGSALIVNMAMLGLVFNFFRSRREL